MATTTPDNIRTPNPSDPYNLVSDLAIMANDVQSALTQRANLYIGTSSERGAFTSAPEGTHWQDTGGDKTLYVRQGGAWVPAWTPSSDVEWTPISPVSPWTGDSSYPPAYTVIGKVAYFRGRVSGSLSAGTMFNLPAGVRPAMLSFFLLERGSFASVSRITVDTTGAVAQSSTNASSAAANLSLNGIVFPVA